MNESRVTGVKLHDAAGLAGPPPSVPGPASCHMITGTVITGPVTAGVTVLLGHWHSVTQAAAATGRVGPDSPAERTTRAIGRRWHRDRAVTINCRRQSLSASVSGTPVTLSLPRPTNLKSDFKPVKLPHHDSDHDSGRRLAGPGRSE